LIDAATRPLLWAGLSAFLFALILGLAFRKSVTWELVDLIYYPLSAVGAFLLFMTSVADRKTVTLNRQISEVTSRVALLEKGRPDFNIGFSNALLDSSTGLLRTVVELSHACGTLYDAKCAVARAVGPVIGRNTPQLRTNSGGSTETDPTSRVVAVCGKAPAMLQSIRDSHAISALVADELLAHYAEGGAAGVLSGRLRQGH